MTASERALNYCVNPDSAPYKFLHYYHYYLPDPVVDICGTPLTTAMKFYYQGSILINNGSLTDKLTQRIIITEYTEEEGW